MTQAQHAQQAAELARAEGHPPHVMIGALLHDIGNLILVEVFCVTLMMMMMHLHDFYSNNDIDENVLLYAEIILVISKVTWLGLKGACQL